MTKGVRSNCEKLIQNLHHIYLKIHWGLFEEFMWQALVEFPDSSFTFAFSGTRPLHLDRTNLQQKMCHFQSFTLRFSVASN